MGEPGDIEVLQQREGSLNVQRVLLIKESQITQAQELVLFCEWEGARVWFPERIHFTSTSAVWASVRRFHILSFLRADGGEWLQPRGCWTAGIVQVPGRPQGSETHLWRPGISDDCAILVC